MHGTCMGQQIPCVVEHETARPGMHTRLPTQTFYTLHELRQELSCYLHWMEMRQVTHRAAHAEWEHQRHCR